MKKIILSLLAVLSVGLVSSVRADDSRTLGPAERNSNLFASGAAVRVNQVYYYYNGYRYHHRHFVGYHTVKVVTHVNGVRYVSYERRPEYRYW